MVICAVYKRDSTDLYAVQGLAAFRCSVFSQPEGKGSVGGDPLQGIDGVVGVAFIYGNDPAVANKRGEPICTAVTDENGHLNFVTDNRKIISFQERAQDESNPQLYYVLEETKRPTGYRSKGDISLYYSIYNEDTREGVLLSYNYWQTGAYTQAMLDVTMTRELYEYTYDATTGGLVAGARIGAGQADIDEYLDNGILFAVPIKRMNTGDSLYAEENYHAIYGTINTGWTLMTENITHKASVLEAARGMMEAMRQTRQSGTIIAERNARQLFQVTVTNIPGDVKLSYPYLMQTDNVDQSEYNVAFYFAPNAQTLDDIEDPDTIVRIATATPEGERFARQHASQFYVSNTLNRLRVQKLDYRGNRLAGATFHMYQTYSTWARPGYVLVEKGSADTAHVGMYYNPAVVNDDGTLKSRSDILEDAKTWDSGTTLSEGSIGTGGLDLDGAIIFPTAFDTYIYGDQTDHYRIDPNNTSTYMEEGEYLIYEAAVPAGYTINETPIAVAVNDDGVFADAGEINDGIRVGQYAGWVLNSMSQFAAESAVDETLTFINTTLMVRDSDGLQAPEEGKITWLNKYSNENHRYIFFAEDMGYYVTAGRNLYQFTDAGMPQLLVKQNSSVTAKALILDGEYKKYSGPGHLVDDRRRKAVLIRFLITHFCRPQCEFRTGYRAAVLVSLGDAGGGDGQHVELQHQVGGAGATLKIKHLQLVLGVLVEGVGGHAAFVAPGLGIGLFGGCEDIFQSGGSNIVSCLKVSIAAGFCTHPIAVIILCAVKPSPGFPISPSSPQFFQCGDILRKGIYFFVLHNRGKTCVNHALFKINDCKAFVVDTTQIRYQHVVDE